MARHQLCIIIIIIIIIIIYSIYKAYIAIFNFNNVTVERSILLPIPFHPAQINLDIPPKLTKSPT